MNQQQIQETEERISKLDTRTVEMIQSETQRKQTRKKMKRASGTCGNKRSDILITEVLEGEDKKGMANKVIKIWQKIKHTDSRILANPNSISFKKYTSRHTMCKLVKTRDKGKIMRKKETRGRKA